MSPPLPFELRVERHVAVPMRDGVTLRADVWRPADPGRYPVLLQRLPYNKSDSLVTSVFAGLEPLRAVEHGYIVVIQDTRGRFTSDGIFDPITTEADDGEDTIAWARELPSANGQVAMFGISYVGATQLLAATRNPDGLDAIAPHLTGSDYYEGWTYQGGALQLGFALYWALASLGMPELLRRESSGTIDARLRQNLQDLLDDPDSAYAVLPLTAVEPLGTLVPSYGDWLAHPTRDSFWQSRAINDVHSQIATPGLHIGGWYDIFLSGTLDNFVGLQAGAATQHARDNQRLVIGPWSHGVLFETVGELNFGPAAAEAALDMTALQLDWFDAFLTGNPGASWQGARVQLFVMGENRWRDEEQWPLARARPVRFFLHADGTLSAEPPTADAATREYSYDPADPVPTVGGSTYLPGLFIGQRSGPKDQRQLSHRLDVLRYLTDPLDQDIEVTGPLKMTLHAATSCVDTDWTAKLIDVYPDGRELILTDGILRGRYRAGLNSPVLLEPGTPYAFEIDLVATSNLFLAGHRIRIDISSSNFPRFDRNPNHGGVIAEATSADFMTAHQTVFHDAERPSFIDLPVVPLH